MNIKSSEKANAEFTDMTELIEGVESYEDWGGIRSMIEKGVLPLIIEPLESTVNSLNILQASVSNSVMP